MVGRAVLVGCGVIGGVAVTSQVGRISGLCVAVPMGIKVGASKTKKFPLSRFSREGYTVDSQRGEPDIV